MATIMLIEDQEPVRNLVRIRLEEWGYSVICPTSLDEAFTHLNGEEHPALLLTDNNLWDARTGAWFVYQIRDQRLCPEHVILMSGIPDEARRDTEQLGIPLLEKPVNFELLKAMLAILLEPAALEPAPAPAQTPVKE